VRSRIIRKRAVVVVDDQFAFVKMVERMVAGGPSTQPPSQSRKSTKEGEMLPVARVANDIDGVIFTLGGDDIRIQKIRFNIENLERSAGQGE